MIYSYSVPQNEKKEWNTWFINDGCVNKLIYVILFVEIMIHLNVCLLIYNFNFTFWDNGLYTYVLNWIVAKWGKQIPILELFMSMSVKAIVMIFLKIRNINMPFHITLIFASLDHVS
jgi:hypothetical protein